MGIIVSPDTGQTFYSGAAEDIAVAKLDANTFVVAYRDGNDSNQGKVVVCTRTGTTISVGTIYEFETNETIYIDVCALSSSLIVISYKDITSNKLEVIAGSISGTVITFGTAVSSTYVPTGSTAVVAMDSSTFVVVFPYSEYVLGYVGSVSGTTILLGALQGTSALGLATHWVDAVNLNSTDFYAAWIVGSSTQGSVGVVNIGAKTFNFASIGNPTASSRTYTGMTVSAFDGLHPVLFYITATDNYVVAGSINDISHVVSYGSEVSDTANVTYIKICTMDSTHFLVSYCDTDDLDQGKVRAGSLSGSTTLAWDDEGAITFDTDTITYTGVCNLDGEYFLIGFKED
jgi:hypothetical protein